MSALPGTTGRRRIYLMRHGHVNYFSRQVRETGDTSLVPLTELGQAQARAAGQALAHVTFDRAICSGYPRTEQTAKLALEQLDTTAPELEYDRRLVEIHGGGFGPVMEQDDIAAVMTFTFDQAAEPDAKMGPAGEVFGDAMDRAVAGINDLLNSPNWHTALVVAHEGINRLLLGWCTGNGLKAIQAFEQDPACINIIDVDLVPKETGEGTEIVRKIIKAVNVTPYNYVKHGMNMTSLEAIFARDPA
jgi:probable phosphoglycerate mutase